jgi:hypothetical protein
MTRALNIKIQDTIYSQLDQHAREHNVTKTQIVEMALSQWFSGNIDSSGDDGDSSGDDGDATTKTPKDKRHYLESSNDIEKMITNKVAEYLLGIACPIPEDSGTDENVDSSGENVDSSGSGITF